MQETIDCPTCKSEGFELSILGPDQCTFCDGTEGGHPPELLLEVGATYRAKKPAKIWSFATGPCMNDRTILWISPGGARIQYDGPAVRNGLHYPLVTREAFLKWAGRRL